MASIEDEIKQKRFENEFHKLTINIMFTAAWMNARTHQLFKPYGISSQQYNILRILRGQYPNPAPLKLLTERMIDRMSNTSRLVDKLVNKKLAERTVCTDNRRQVDIIITKNGIDLLNQLQEHVSKEVYRLNVNEKEAIILNELLDKMRE